MSETSSVNSGSSQRLMQLSQNGDWLVLEQTIKGMDKGDPELTAVDEESGWNLLMIAVRENRLSVVDRLLELGVSPRERTKDGMTVLHIAAAHAKEDIMKLLVRREDCNSLGGPKDQLPLHFAASRAVPSLSILQTLLKFSNKEARLVPDKDGCIPLHLAVETGNVGIVKELLGHQSEPQLTAQKTGSGDAALHICCRRKDTEMAKVLIQYGANVDIQNEEGHTPLHIVAWEGDKFLLKLFYQNKANPDIIDKMDRSPLHIAAERGHSYVVDVLTDKFKANVLARTKDGSTMMHIASQCGHPDTALTFMKKGVPLHMPNKSGAVCLHAAAKQGHTAVVQALLLKGAHVDMTTKDGLTALHVAVQNGKPLVVQMLLGFGAQVQLGGGKARETPLHIAARVKGGEKVAEMLLKSGADVNAEQENGETPMHIAARYGGLKMMKILIEEGGELTCRSKAGENPLHIAVRHCHAAVVEEILTYLTNNKSREEAQRCVSQGNRKGETSLHLAAELQTDSVHREGEDVHIIKTLMEYDKDITVLSETPLHYCARMGNTGVLQEMLDNVPSSRLQVAVNKHSKNGWSPLLVAAERGHPEVVSILLQNQARVDVFDEEGKGALHLAAEQGHEDVADILLSHKAFVNAKTKLGLTPLHLGAQKGSAGLVKLLVERHLASIDSLSLRRQTPLHLAAVSGQLDVCSSLLTLGADVTATDIHGQTPLHLAAENDHSEVVKLFLKHRPSLATLSNAEGATCTHIAAAKGSLAVVRELLTFNQGGVNTLSTKTTGSSPLHLASAGGHTEVVRVLLDAGASAADEDREGMSAVHLAARNGHTHILEVLKESISLEITSSKTGMTALHVAACFGQAGFVRELLMSVPATIRSDTVENKRRSRSGYTALHLAARFGHENVVRLLLNSPGVQADVETDVHGSTPLHLAAQNGHMSVIGLLLSRSGSLLHLTDRQGCTGLHLASASGHVAMVRVLLGQGAEINHTDKSGWTPLHYAAKAGCLDIVRILVERGASASVECLEGRTPLQYAAGENHQGVVSFLLQREDNNIRRLLEDKKFVFDMMVCGKLHSNTALDDLILHSAAPLDTAVRLSRALALTALRVKDRYVDLMAAAQYCESLASDLLSLASPGGKGAGVVLRSVDHRGVSMVDCLIDAMQKEVVAHPAVQKYLTEVWHGPLQWDAWKIVLLFFALLICPPLWLFVSLPLKHRFNTIPILKFMTHLVSHIFLLALFIITIVYPPLNPIHRGCLMPSWGEWLLLTWLVGVLVSELTQPGVHRSLAWIRVFVLVFSAAACFCHILALVLQNLEQSKLNCLFARNFLLAIAMTLGFVQLLEFLTFHHLFGPWAIIIRDLMKDLGRFAVIVVLFHTTFTLSLYAVCQPGFPPANNPNNSCCNQGNTCGQQEMEPTLHYISFLLFFALFGLTGFDEIGKLKCSLPACNVVPHLVFGIYMVVTVIVLINLLIAMMSDTYQRIQAQSDTEWKFGRAVLIREMSWKSGTPSPLNLFTNLFFYIKAFYKHGGKICSAEGQGLMTEEEDAEGLTGPDSLDMLAHTSVAWKRSTMKTQILPESDLNNILSFCM
uniref:Ion transport domain-containing protein n=1 Tax=Esox lucius TaxID=8010 RepID=A0A3P8Z511_ESOLU